ncbi:hypothetical protein BOTBODRAFT_80251, partial [Botryobasidium botryosum FD-172 SS1]
PTPMPHTPAGGIGTSNHIPVYHPLSDFDFQSLQLGLYQEYIELDLFEYGLQKFSVDDFEAAGLNAADRFLIEFMAEQEAGHAQLITNMLGPLAAQRCSYQYPFNTVAEFVDFCQKLTRWGESGVYGFLEHLDSRDAAQNLLQSITTEARQQMIFRQFEGLFPMPVWFEVGITQSMTWTLLAPYVKSCPQHNDQAPLVWANFPTLTITNNPSGSDPNFPPAVSTNRTQLSAPGREVNFQWEATGKSVGPDGKYTTSSTAGPAFYAMWQSQLNTTYTPLYNIGGDGLSASTCQPDGFVYPGDPVVNGTIFVTIVDQQVPFVTTSNISYVNPHIVAGPAVYQSG